MSACQQCHAISEEHMSSALIRTARLYRTNRNNLIVSLSLYLSYQPLITPNPQLWIDPAASKTTGSNSSVPLSCLSHPRLIFHLHLLLNDRSGCQPHCCECSARLSLIKPHICECVHVCGSGVNPGSMVWSGDVLAVTGAFINTGLWTQGSRAQAHADEEKPEQQSWDRAGAQH